MSELKDMVAVRYAVTSPNLQFIEDLYGVTVEEYMLATNTVVANERGDMIDKGEL